MNSAGILRFEHSHEVALESWQQILDVNLTGTFLMCQAAIPALLDGGGAIVNVSSTAALAAHPWAAAYSASKGGVLALTRTLAIEYAKQGLRANAVCPGSIDTPITDAFHLPEGADGKLLYRIMSPTGMGDASQGGGRHRLPRLRRRHPRQRRRPPHRRRHPLDEVLLLGGVLASRRARGRSPRRATSTGWDTHDHPRPPHQPGGDAVDLPVHGGRRPALGDGHRVARPVDHDRPPRRA